MNTTKAVTGEGNALRDYYAVNEGKPGHEFIPKFSHEKTAILLDEAIAQRDELLAACKAQLNAHTPYMIRQAATNARAAIAKAEQH